MKKLLALAACLSLAVGCAREAAPEPRRRKVYRIAVIPKGTTHEFWRSVHAGAEQAAKELGNVEVIWKGPLQESDREGQISLVQDFVTKRVDGICLAPLDSQALVAAVRGAKAEGIPTVIFDIALADESDIVSYVATDNYRCGELAARRWPGCSTAGARSHPVALQPGQRKHRATRARLSRYACKEFPDVQILSSNQYSGTSFEDALSVSQQLLLKFGDQVDGVFTVCEPNSTGMLACCRVTPSWPAK